MIYCTFSHDSVVLLLTERDSEILTPSCWNLSKNNYMQLHFVQISKPVTFFNIKNTITHINTCQRINHKYLLFQ